MAATIMIQGTGSHVGKSILATALCRIFAQDGLRVAPFKSQNMALNSFVTREGGEMGRSQVVQAEAAGVDPHVDMNPILLKPTSDMGSQVIVRGKAVGTMKWQAYSRQKERYLAAALAAFERLYRRFDVIVIEGAGSPAEVNLREGDIVNMRIARETQSPVYLVTDIDRGGALAWVVGTMELLQPKERALVKGIVFNKFRGDVEILRPGLTFLEERLGVPVVGVIPYLQNLAIAQEDSVSLEETQDGDQTKPEGPEKRLNVAVLQLARISNFTDVDSLKHEPDVRIRFVKTGQRLGSPDLLLLPGSKNTIDDLWELWETGLVEQIREYARGGGCVVGICGGYQMLGRRVSDPHGTESMQGAINGIGLLPVTTVLRPEKITVQVSGRATFPGEQSSRVTGYEIHTGHTERYGGHPWITITQSEGTGRGGGLVEDGCYLLNEEGRGGAVFGTYIHGIFDGTRFRRQVLNFLRERKGWKVIEPAHAVRRDPYDSLAETVRTHLDIEQLYRTMGLQPFSEPARSPLMK